MPKWDFNKVPLLLEMTLRQVCSPVNLLHIFWTSPFSKEHLLKGCFWNMFPGMGTISEWRISKLTRSQHYSFFNPLRASPTKWSTTLKQFVGNSRRIVLVCLTILWCWCLKSYSEELFSKMKLNAIKAIQHSINMENGTRKTISKKNIW